MTIRNIRKVRTISKERVDKPDFDAGADNVYAYIESMLGGLLGYGGGLLSPPKLTYTDNGVTYNVALGAFHAYWSQRDTYDAASATYRGWRGKVLSHVPGGSQVSILDYTANRAAAVAANVVPTGIPAGTAGAFPYLWMRPTEVDTDNEARRYWDGSDEAGVAIDTRTTTYLSFIFADSPPSSSGGEWTPIGKITAWTGAGTATITTPTLALLSVWDGGGIKGSAAYSDPWAWADNGEGSWDEGLLDSNNSTVSWLFDAMEYVDVDPSGFGALAEPQNRSLGLIQLLYIIRSRIKRVISTDGTTSWLASTTGITLEALKTALDANTAALAALSRSKVIASAVCIWDPGTATYSVNMSTNLSTATLPAGWAYAAGSGTMVLKWGLPAPAASPAGVGDTGSVTVQLTPGKNADGTRTLGQFLYADTVYAHNGTEWILDVKTLDSAGVAKPGSFIVTVTDAIV